MYPHPLLPSALLHPPCHPRGAKARFGEYLAQLLPPLAAQPVASGGPAPFLHWPNSSATISLHHRAPHWLCPPPWPVGSAPVPRRPAGPTPGLSPRRRPSAGCVGGELAAGASCVRIPALWAPRGSVDPAAVAMPEPWLMCLTPSGAAGEGLGRGRCRSTHSSRVPVTLGHRAGLWAELSHTASLRHRLRPCHEPPRHLLSREGAMRAGRPGLPGHAALLPAEPLPAPAARGAARRHTARHRAGLSRRPGPGVGAAARRGRGSTWRRCRGAARRHGQ